MNIEISRDDIRIGDVILYEYFKADKTHCSIIMKIKQRIPDYNALKNEIKFLANTISNSCNSKLDGTIGEYRIVDEEYIQRINLSKIILLTMKPKSIILLDRENKDKI